MKKMNLKIVIVTAVLMVWTTFEGLAQEYKIPASGTDLILKLNEINKIEIEGISGSEIIFSTLDRNHKRNERAEGLRAINSLGLEDNTGIGLAVEKDGNSIDVFQVSRRSSSRYLVKVPQNVMISYEHSGVHGSRVYFRNIKSELEISTNHSSVNMENVTGPLTVNTVHGKIEAVFESLNQNAPTSIVSVHGLIDLTLPESTKADISIKTGWGEIFTDMDIDIEKTNSDLKSYSSQVVRGKLNGGGVQLNIKTSHSNIYIRKK